MKILKLILIMFYEKSIIFSGILVLRKKALKIRKKSISLIRVISQIYSKKFLKILLKLILTNMIRHSHKKNYSTALRKLTASAIGSVFDARVGSKMKFSKKLKKQLKPAENTNFFKGVKQPFAPRNRGIKQQFYFPKEEKILYLPSIADELLFTEAPTGICVSSIRGLLK